MAHATTASQKPSFKASWRVCDAAVCRVNAGWTTSKGGYPCPCQSCSRGHPVEKTVRGFLENRPSCYPDDPIGQGTELNWTWREATLVTIPKPCNDLPDSNNYRPIALTIRLYKTMDIMVNSWLIWVVESKGLLASEQCGFRKTRSTADHLVCFVSYISQAFAKKEHVIAIFFDVENAYNTTWGYGIRLIFMTLILEAISAYFYRLFQVRAGSTLICMNRRWVFPRVASF